MEQFRPVRLAGDLPSAPAPDGRGSHVPGRRAAIPIGAAQSGLIATATTTIALLVLGPSLPAFVSASLLVAAAGCYGWMVIAEARRPALRLRHVVAATVVVFGVAVAVPPRSSADIWSYAMYGRMVAVHEASPYVKVPSAFSSDPAYRRVAPVWRHTGSAYGPVFTGMSAAIAPFTGASRLRTRLAYEGIAAAAMAVALALVWRRTRSPAALAWLGLHPVIVLQVVNVGKNDALVGLAILGAVLLAQRRRWGTAGTVAALGTAVKATGGLAGIGLVIWIWRREGRRAAVVFASRMAAVLAVVYLVAGAGAATIPLRVAEAHATHFTLWSLFGRFGLSAPPPALAFGVVAAAAVVALMRYTRRSAASAAIAGPGAFVLASPYVLPSYAAWLLPAAALERREVLARILALQAVVLVVVYVLMHSIAVSSTVIVTAQTVAGVASAVLLVSYLGLSERRPRGRGARALEVQAT